MKRFVRYHGMKRRDDLQGGEDRSVSDPPDP
ncbi:MAG: hypothetical protein ACE5G0_19705 [Rhodothermales bacterium]